jgi:iron(III) transport system permease protein
MTQLSHVEGVGRFGGKTSLATRLKHFDPAVLVFLLVAAVLVFLVVNPLLRLVFTSLQTNDGSAWTLANYVSAYSRRRYLDALLNSLILGAAVSALCVVLAVPMAWAVSRTDMPLKATIRVLVLGAFITPPYLGAIGWILLAGPNSGWLNRIVTALTGAEQGPFNIYSFEGLVFVIAIYSFPYLFIFTSAALDLVSSELEDAANILGAGTWRTTMKVTLPLVLPAILGGVIVIFLEAIALFGSPALIALPARINVVTTQLWQFFGTPARPEVAAAYAMPLLAVTVALFAWQRGMMRRKGFVSLTGKGGDRRLIPLGPWRWVLLGYCFFVLSLSVVLPYATLSQAAFTRAWGRGLSFDNLTFANFRYILFEHHTAQQSVVNSFLYAAATACLAVVIALFIAYIVVRKMVPGARALGFLCMAPFVIPGIVLAIGFYAAYASPPLSLYNTAWILILAFTTRFLPIAYANSEAAIRSLNPEMEEAVRILGGGRLTALRRVTAPLLKGSLVGAWLLVFIPATRELSAAIFLYGPNTRTMAVMLFDMSEEGNFEYLSALGFLLLAASVVLVGIGYRLVGRDFMLRR